MERVLTGISQAKLQELSAILKEKTNITLHGHEGIVEMHGFAVSYLYCPDVETLTLKLVKKPWFVPMSLVASKLDQYLSGPEAALLRDIPAKS